MTLIISCEHASNRVPEKLAPLFQGHSEVLAGHLSYDLGAAELAHSLSSASKSPLLLSLVSRLVVDCNRSLSHPRLFSEFSRTMPPLEKEAVLAEWYLPYRMEIYRTVQQTISRTGHCLHFSVHTFTPELNGRKRTAELGLLYDPSRMRERNFCRTFAQAVSQKFPKFRARFNYPYRGVSDGMVAALRKSFRPEQYIGIELELNQSIYCQNKGWPLDLCQQLGRLLRNQNRE
jgi:predicted N-formylglutamate amidohydrolase